MGSDGDGYEFIHREAGGTAVPFTPEEFDQAIYDIVNFLYYTGDPSRLERHRTGIYVLLFLLVLYVFTYLLGREYHKEVVD